MSLSTFSRARDEIIKELTRIRPNVASCIDLAISDSPGLVKGYEILPPVGNSDHSSIFLSYDLNLSTQSLEKKVVWKYNKCNIANLLNDLRQVNVDEFLNINDIDKLVFDLTNKLYSIIDKNIPKKTWALKAQ